MMGETVAIILRNKPHTRIVKATRTNKRKTSTGEIRCEYKFSTKTDIGKQIEVKIPNK